MDAITELFNQDITSVILGIFIIMSGKIALVSIPQIRLYHKKLKL